MAYLLHGWSGRLAVGALCQHVRAMSSLSEGALFIGGYTPITKQLWLDRHTAKKAEPAAAVAGMRAPQAITIQYNFTTDKVLHEMYRNPWGYVRMGRLLEDLDSLAGNVAFQHCYNGGDAPLLVTAAVDEIHARQPLTLNSDMAVSGQVVWTGKSSMDVRVQLFQAGALGLEALFSYVHLDPKTSKASPVVQLKPVTPADEDAYKQRQQVADARRAARQASKGEDHITVPRAAKEWLQEARRVQELPALANSDVVLMPATSLSNTFICQPQQRNPHGRIFGGFLMRRAYELGFATTYMFGGRRPAFVKVDEISFHRPVDVGSLLRLHSCVVHSETSGPHQGRVTVEVEARVTRPEAVDSFVSNTFRFVFEVRDSVGMKLKRVLPTNEDEAVRCWQAQSSTS